MSRRRSGGKGGGGSAPDREFGAVARAANSKGSPHGSLCAEQIQLTVTERLFVFCENGIVLTVLGIIGGFAGVFVAGRYFLLLSIPLLLGLHRSPALKGLQLRGKVLGYVAVLAVSLPLLWLLGLGIDGSREQIPKVSEIAKGVVEALPRPAQAKFELNHPVTKDALQVLNFDSIGEGITVKNDSTAYFATIISVVYSTAEGYSQSSNRAVDIPPERVEQVYLGDDSLKGVTFDILPPLSRTWQGQLDEAGKKFSGCVAPAFFSPSGAALQQVTDHYRKLKLGTLPTGNGAGVLVYMIRKIRKTVKFPLKVLVAKRRDCVGSPPK